MNPLAAIHVARKQLGLDDDAYRAVLQRVTGKASAKEMSEAERRAVVAELRRLGFGAYPPRRLEGKYAPKLQALWIAAWNLGLTRSRDDRALLAFIRRQTGIDDTRFLRYGDDAARVIEALKAWLARDGGVDWGIERRAAAWTQANGYRIARAQAEILRRIHPGFAGGLEPWLAARGLEAAAMSPGQWMDAMNELGWLVRAARMAERADG